MLVLKVVREKKSLKKLSQGVNQQVATWSPDSRHIAFVKDNNLFVTDGDKETQITRDGKFNEVINGIPDWVYEEEFSFNRAFAWNADGTAIGWIRFDESHVKTYSLLLHNTVVCLCLIRGKCTQDILDYKLLGNFTMSALYM